MKIPYVGVDLNKIGTNKSLKLNFMGHYIKHKKNYWERKIFNEDSKFDNGSKT